jgi:hypothetical protein
MRDDFKKIVKRQQTLLTLQNAYDTMASKRIFWSCKEVLRARAFLLLMMGMPDSIPSADRIRRFFCIIVWHKEEKPCY